ncbi:MAG: PKD domain-containing protein, partial [Planctomycetes bacterium]|nr:PKD domain-containing protein [Planctomycetota bacterium]
MALGILFPLGAAGPSALQLGHVVKAQKISATSGGFDAVLEEMDQFGRSIVNLGDLDGDGLTDILVGAHTDDDGGLDKGSVYVLFLRANGFVKAWQKISDLEGNFVGQLDRGDQFGRAAANLGDLDGDGVVDVAVSSNYDDDDGANKGAVYILFLNTDGTVKQSQKISALAGGLPAPLNIHDEFGRSLTALGDLDGDGLCELLVGTPEDDEGGTNTGALHVLFLNANGTVKNYRRISKFSSGLALKPGDWFGFCSANLGDFDGDGVVDVAVGSVLDDDGGVNQGSLWILFLNADGSVKAAREIDELEGGLPALDDIDQFGTSVTKLGDLDGDGVIDIAVGTVKDDDGGTEGDPDADVGAVYVLFLNPDASVKSWVKLSDTSGSLPFALDQWDWFGSALAPLGGMSGDGLFNVAIGCRNDDDAGGNHGAVYLVQLNDGTAPAAQFEASATLGIAPLTVAFTDTSTGNVTGWVWNFGDGGAQSNLRGPSRTYTTPGTYDVQLTARGPKGVDAEIKRGLITVASGLLASFDAGPRTGPCPLSVGFSDLSQGAINSWSWDFGDGQVSNLANPTHVYAACGTYTVALTVSGPNGTHTRTESDFVVAALVPPAAEFTALPASGPAPLDVQFGDATGGQVTSWSWDFGDGQFSNLASPLHRYAAEGTYTVTLTAVGPAGSDVETKLAFVTVTGPPPSAYFEATPTIGPEPLTVSFLDVTTGLLSSWAWSFGDGATSSERHPAHTYSGPGLYTVTLVVDGPNGGDVRTLTDLITVEPGVPAAAFGATPASGPAPLVVQFTDLSTLTVTGRSWSFGDGTSSSAKNPQHTYANPGLYSVALTVTGPGGSDTHSIADLITVSAPPTVADFGAAPASGVAPLSVAFTDLSSSNATGWAWDFGDGTASTLESPVHVFAAPGTYDVTLSVTSPTGTDARTYPGLITVLQPPPEAGFAASPTLGVAPLAAKVTVYV